MIKAIIKIFKILMNDLLKAYSFILLHPLRITTNYLFNNKIISQLKRYLLRFILLPIFNISFFLLYYLIVSPIKNYFLSFVVPKIYNSSKFLYMLNECDSRLLNNTNNHYKYLLFNRDNNKFKFPDPETRYDNLFHYLMHTKKIISPGWRQHHLHFYHEDLKQYRDLLYDNSIRMLLRKSVESLLLNSLSISVKNFMLLYRFIQNNLDAMVYELYCYGRYKFKNIFLKEFNYSYKLLKIICSLIIKINSFLIITCNNQVIKLIFEVLSIGEVGTERSIYYSKRFGFSGNLYLDNSYFINSWNLNLTKHNDVDLSRPYNDYKHTELWPYERKSIKGKILRRLYYNWMKFQHYPSDMYNYSNEGSYDNKYKTKEHALRYRLSQAVNPRLKNTYRYSLKNKSNFLIKRELLVSFNKKFNLYFKLYQLFGKLTKYILFFKKASYFSRLKNNNSVFTSYLQRPFADANILLVSVIVIVSLESMFFIAKTMLI